MADLSSLRFAISTKIGLDSTAGSSELAMMDSWINEGIVDFLLKTKCYVAVGTMTLSAGAGDYRLPDPVLEITEISLGGTRLLRKSPHEIQEMRLANQSATPSTSIPAYYALEGASLLLIHPLPQQASTLAIYYVPQPTPLSSPADDPSAGAFGGIPVEYHKAIEYYALIEAADYDDDSSSTIGQLYQQRYLDRVRDFRKRQFYKGGRRLSRAVVGRRQPQAAPDSY